MKTRRFDFNFRPLQIDICMVVDGSVPDMQNYDADTDTFIPDYTITPLTVTPAISRLDKDEILSAGRINQSLANIKWYEVSDGVKTLIDTSNDDYEIQASGGEAGRIKIKKNAKPQIPIDLYFYAEYTDTRNNQLHIIQQTFQVRCQNSTPYIPLLVLDAADQTAYDPLMDATTQTITASLMLGENECPTEKRSYVWEKFREDGTWSEVGADETLDYDILIGPGGDFCTVFKELMGEELYLRCRAKYDLGGNPDDVTLNENSPQKIVSFIRRVPKFEFDIAGAPVNIPAGLLAIAPEAKIWNTKGEIDNPERYLLPLWYAATNKASGSLSYALVGHGMNPTLETSPMSQTLGAVYGLDVVDVGPDCAWEDSDGVVFVDADDKVILIR